MPGMADRMHIGPSPVDMLGARVPLMVPAFFLPQECWVYLPPAISLKLYSYSELLYGCGSSHIYSCKWWYGHERLLPGRRICGIIMKIGVGHVTSRMVMER